jgi:hypothetical protein
LRIPSPARAAQRPRDNPPGRTAGGFSRFRWWCVLGAAGRWRARRSRLIDSVRGGVAECTEKRGSRRRVRRGCPGGLGSAGERRLRRASGKTGHRETGGRKRVITSMRGAIAGGALLFDVRDLTVGADFAVAPGDASAPECGESEQTNKTHHGSPPKAKVSNVCTAELPKAVSRIVWKSSEETPGGVKKTAHVGSV